jgi:hypothetical protein
MSEEKKAYRIEGRVQTIYRVVKSAENPYVMIDRRPVDNPKMSWKAKGMLTYLMSRPDGWEVSVADLINHATDGEASTRAGLRELRDAGHMKYTKMREKGRITGWLIEVFEIPDGDFLHVEKQDVENRRQVLSTLSNNKESNKYFKQPKKPDLIDMEIEQGNKAKAIKETTDFFEKTFGFGALNWDSSPTWRKFAKWIFEKKDDSGAFKEYVTWRNGKGQYKGAMTNTAIRRDPQIFMDTGWPTFLAYTSMYVEKQNGTALERYIQQMEAAQ